MREAVALADSVVRANYQCSLQEVHTAFYKHCPEGKAQLFEAVENITYWNGHVHDDIGTSLTKRGRLLGKKEYLESIKLDKFKSLYIDDSIGLHDKQLICMRKMLPGAKDAAAGTSAIKEARKEMNDEVHSIMGLTPTPSGTGWQCNIPQLLRYICYVAELNNLTVPDNPQFRITYDGAEVGGHPGVIGHLVPMNFGMKLQDPHTAYPLFFCRCAEKGLPVLAFHCFVFFITNCLVCADPAPL